MKFDQAIAYLSRFTDITPEEFQAMSELVHVTRFPKNEILLRQGDIARNAAIIIKGSVRVYFMDEKGVDHTIDFMFENEPLLSLESFFNQSPSASSVVTLEPTELIYTSHEELIQFMDRFPKYQSVIRNIMSEELVLDGVHARLLRIGNSRERYEALCKLRPEVIKRVPSKHIASYLEMAIETLSRVRAGKL